MNTDARANSAILSVKVT